MTKADQDLNTKKWTVSIERESGTRTFVVNHVVFALGFGGGMPQLPKIDGMASAAQSTYLLVAKTAMTQDEFSGKIIHSIQYTSTKDYIGKKVIVLGSCTSGEAAG